MNETSGRTTKLILERTPETSTRFVVAEGAHPGASLIVSRARHTIGRHPTNDLVLDDPSVSLVHLEVYRTAGKRVLVRDAGSTNGTWFGEHRLREAELAPGAMLRLGRTMLRVESDPQSHPLLVSEGERFEGLIGQAVEMRELFAVLDRMAARNLCRASGRIRTGPSGCGGQRRHPTASSSMATARTRWWAFRTCRCTS